MVSITTKRGDHGQTSLRDGSRVSKDDARMEHIVNDFSAGYRFHFVLPGTDITDALLHLTRAKVRTCERRLTALQRLQPVPEALPVYMNRLSDFIFCLIEKHSDVNR